MGIGKQGKSGVSMSGFLTKIVELPKPCQDAWEWQAYLEFIETYFENREIENPIVVEIGVFTNKQKRFYEELLGYQHIGIDIDPKSKADIIGDSQDPATLSELKERLGGRPINLLFIDGHHGYESVKKDYETYSPLVKNIIALHDVVFYKRSVAKFWRELIDGDRGNRSKIFITIETWHNNPRKGIPHNKDWSIGTGLILLETLWGDRWLHQF